MVICVGLNIEHGIFPGEHRVLQQLRGRFTYGQNVSDELGKSQLISFAVHIQIDSNYNNQTRPQIAVGEKK